MFVQLQTPRTFQSDANDSTGLFCHSLPIRTRHHAQQRLISQTTPLRADGDGDQPPTRSNPVLEQYRRDNPDEPAARQKMPTPGDLSASSIFEDDRRAQEQARTLDDSQRDDGKIQVGGRARDPANMLPVLDPDPNARERWERKKVIQMITRNGRLSKQEFIKRTEREHLVKSHMMKTSVKKLGKLARQISGKRIEDAITQMRFSRKKVAQEVLRQLEFARDEAIVARGMGLGGAKPADSEEASLLTTSGDSSASIENKTESGKPLTIRLKSNNARHLVPEQSAIYIDQAWVGRGPYGKLPDYRARGRIYVMRTPWTSLSVLLKEEGTRVREWEEREEKRKRERRERVWVPLPDRPVGGAGAGRGWFAW